MRATLEVAFLFLRSNMLNKPRLIIAVSGASGSIYARAVLELVAKMPIETHLIISDAAKTVMEHEVDFTANDLSMLATVTHDINDIAASISSGSFQTIGMLVAPCSMKTLAEIATGISSNLISRAADVVLKERRKLVLMVRETPFNLVHLRNMTTVTEMGGIIAPPFIATYTKPQSIADAVYNSAGRVLDLMGLPIANLKRWHG
jgi:4-hydroxy-3-polyprenylbenzoate decarboxylase